MVLLLLLTLVEVCVCVHFRLSTYDIHGILILQSNLLLQNLHHLVGICVHHLILAHYLLHHLVIYEGFIHFLQDM